MKLSEKCRILIAPALTAVLLLIIYCIKGIYPFGKMTIDYYDMAQQIAAFYYHVFDSLHGTKSFFYDPYTALGVNMAMSTSGCSNISIFNFFFFFIKRDMLLESLSFFLMLKLMCMSLTMGFYLRKSFKLPTILETVFSVIYAFSGFVFVLYVTIQWLDVAVFFPLIIYYLKKVLFEKKYVLYTFFLTVCLVASYYLSFMILIYIILMTGLFMLSDFVFEKSTLSDEKSEKTTNNRLYVKVKYVASKYNLTGLLLSTITSILLSMFIVLPQLKQTLSSSRFKNGTESSGLLSVYFEILRNYKPAYTTRWWTLLMLSFGFAVIVFGVIRYYKEKKLVITGLAAIILMTAELFFENINLIWHFGSYVQYPIRNGFTINFTIVVIAAMFVEKMFKDGVIKAVSIKCIKNDLRNNAIITLFIALVCFVCLAFGIKWYMLNDGMPLRKVFHITAFIMAISFVVYILTLYIKKAQFVYVIPIVVCAEIIFYGFLLIGKPTFITGYAENPEQEGEYIRICNQLEKAFSIEPDEEGVYLLERVKNPDESLNANYPLVLRRPALSNWTHIISPRLQNSAKKLGYSIEYTRLLDNGGTVFSDALLGVKNVITCVRQDDALYELKDTAKIVTDHITGEEQEYYYYECKYSLPFGFVADTFTDFFEQDDTVDIYNEFYFCLSENKNDKIAEYIYNYETEKGISEQDNKLNLTVERNISGKKAVYYMASQTDRQDENTVIYVNNNVINIPSIKQTDNVMYPAKYNNNAVLLGCFENEEISVNIDFYKYSDESEEYDVNFEPVIFTIDLDKLSVLCSQHNESDECVSIKAKTDRYDIDINKDKKYLYLPISYDEGFNVYVDGKMVKQKSLGDMFTVILLDGGKSVSMTFLPSYMKYGFVISVLAIVMSIVYLVNKKYRVVCDNKNIMCNINLYMTFVCLTGFIFVILLMYIIPAISGAVLWIM